MKSVINNKTYASYIETVDGTIKRTDVTGSVVANVFNFLATAVRNSSAGDTIYVSRFLYQTLKNRDYNFWLNGTFKSGVPLTNEEMDAVINFSMTSGSGVKFNNIDKYTLNDVPDLDHELGLLLIEVVSARTDWNRDHTAVEEKEMIAPVTTDVVASQETVDGFKGLFVHLKEKEEKKMAMKENATIKESMAQIVQLNLSVEDDEDFAEEVKAETVKITVAETPAPKEKVVIELPKENPEPVKAKVSVKKTNDVITINLDKPVHRQTKSSSDVVSIRLEGDNVPSFFVDPFDEEYIPSAEPSAQSPSGLAPASLPLPSDVVVRLVSAVPSPATKVSSAVSNALIRMVAERKSQQ